MEMTSLVQVSSTKSLIQTATRTGDLFRRMPSWKIPLLPTAAFVVVDSEPSGATVWVDGVPAGQTILSVPIKAGKSKNITAHFPGMDYPVMQRTVTINDPADRIVFFDFAGERSIAIDDFPEEALKGDTEYILTWSSTGDIPEVDVLYRVNATAPWFNVARNLPNSGSMEWTVPNIEIQEGQIQVRDSANHAIRGVCQDALKVGWRRPVGPAPAGFSLIPAGTYARGDHKNEPESWMARSRPARIPAPVRFFWNAAAAEGGREWTWRYR